MGSLASDPGGGSKWGPFAWDDEYCCECLAFPRKWSLRILSLADPEYLSDRHQSVLHAGNCGIQPGGKSGGGGKIAGHGNPSLSGQLDCAATCFNYDRSGPLFPLARTVSLAAAAPGR